MCDTYPTCMHNYQEHLAYGQTLNVSSLTDIFSCSQCQWQTCIKITDIGFPLAFATTEQFVKTQDQSLSKEERRNYFIIGDHQAKQKNPST